MSHAYLYRDVPSPAMIQVVMKTRTDFRQRSELGLLYQLIPMTGQCRACIRAVRDRRTQSVSSTACRLHAVAYLPTCPSIDRCPKRATRGVAAGRQHTLRNRSTQRWRKNARRHAQLIGARQGQRRHARDAGAAGRLNYTPPLSIDFQELAVREERHVYLHH